MHDYPLVPASATALDAARIIADGHLPGLVVIDERGLPIAVLPATQVLRAALPKYVVNDPTLARVYAEEMADAVFSALASTSVGDLVKDAAAIPRLDADDTLIEVASLMAHVRSPVVAVMDGPVFVGVITAPRVFEAALPPDGA